MPCSGHSSGTGVPAYEKILLLYPVIFRPAQITITVNADLNQELRDYAILYRTTYGEAESAAELIPFMLEAFLDSDCAFARRARRVCWRRAPANRRVVPGPRALAKGGKLHPVYRIYVPEALLPADMDGDASHA